MVELNKDVLFLIFRYFQDDPKNLFSCLMVNRIWSETAVPILWKHPWYYNINYSKKKYLSTIIASYLSAKTKKSLTKNGGRLPSIPYKQLSFDYLSFGRSFNLPVLKAILSRGSYSQSILQEIYEEIYNHMIKTCSELKYLNIESFKHPNFYFLEYKARLESLCELKCDTFIDPLLFDGLANVCKFIQRLIVINKSFKLNDGLVKLIQVQKNLKYFEWKDDFGYVDDDSVEEPYNHILSALVKSANTLNFLNISFKFVEVYNYDQLILIDVLTKLLKLKSIIIDGDIFFFFTELQLSKMIYRELEIFNMDFISLGEVSIIIANSGRRLKKLQLSYEYYEGSYDNIGDEYLIFIRQIYENCPLLEELSLLLLSSSPQYLQYFNEFEKVLKACKELKSLTLRVESTDDEGIRDEILNILIRSAPTELNEIKFYGDFTFSLRSLDRFLQGWQGRHAISIYVSDPIHKGTGYMKIANKYKSNGVIKDFIYDS